ncbi:MAG: ABC transporter permease [bacterium]
MRIRDSFATALGGLKHGRMRAVLTMLGIVIGISSVIILMSIGQSAQDYIINQVQSIGSNLIFVIPGGSSGSKFSAPASSQGIVIKTLVKADLDALKRETSITAAAPVVSGQAQAFYGDNSVNVGYQGTTADLFPIRALTLKEGYALTSDDVNAFNHVAVIGPDLATTLFGRLDPVGKYLRLGSVSFRVSGILSKGGIGPGGVDQGNIVIIPITVAQGEMLGINYYNMLVIEGNNDYNIDFVQNRIKSVLRQNHGVTDPNKDDFTIRTQADALAILGSITSVLTLFLTAIACISLVVGGVGIMNIMLVSVTERTKEIGLRKAVGATDNDILQQFLVESVLLTFLGGLIGIIVGAIVVTAIYFGVTLFTSTEWTFALPMSAILIAVAVSTITGLLFGIYPARKAGRKSPMEALRYE